MHGAIRKSWLPSRLSTTRRRGVQPKPSVPFCMRWAADASCRWVPIATAGGTLHAQVLTPDGDQSVCCTLAAAAGESAAAQGRRAAEQLIERGALELLETA